MAPDIQDSELTAMWEQLRPVAWWLWLRSQREAPGEGSALREAIRALVGREAVAASRLIHALSAIDRAGVDALLFKGAALSYSIYPEPWLRPRNDDDVLVAADQFDAARAVLTGQGYRELPANPGAERTGQAHYVRSVGDRDCHHIDLHWRALVPAAFHGLPAFSDLRRSAVPLPALGPSARGLDAPHALLITCAHRVAHHGIDEDPQWLIDVHVLASSLDAQGWSAFTAAATSSRLASVCRFELARAAETLGTHVPTLVLSDLGRVRGEASARHLHAGGRLHRLWLDLGDRTGDRWPALFSRLFPSREYMRARYGGLAVLLPVAYLWRVTAGTGRWVLDALGRRAVR